MRELTGDPYDRDSDTYKAVVGPHIYDSLIRTGMIVAAGTRLCSMPRSSKRYVRQRTNGCRSRSTCTPVPA